MTQDIRERLRAVPFVPFIIHTSDGKDYPVPHEDFAWVLPRGTRVDVADEDERTTRIPVLHISGVSDAPAGGRPKRSGRK